MRTRFPVINIMVTWSCCDDRRHGREAEAAAGGRETETAEPKRGSHQRRDLGALDHIGASISSASICRGRRGGDGGRHVTVSTAVCLQNVADYLELPVGRLQDLLGLLPGAARRQDELVDHHLLA